MCKEDSNPKYKKADKWVKWTTDFNITMVTNAYDIRAKSPAYQQKLEQQFSVKITLGDEAFYLDNCHTRRKAAANIAESSPEEREFPVVHIKTGRKSINKKVIRYTVQPKYKVIKIQS